MNRKQQITAFLALPIEVGHMVNIDIKYQESDTITEGKGKSKKIVPVKIDKLKSGYGKVINIINNDKLGKLYVVKSDGFSVPHQVQIDLEGTHFPYGTNLLKEEWVTKNVDKIGADPFKKDVPKIRFLEQDISSLLLKAGYGRGKNYDKPEYKICNSGKDEEKEYFNCTYGGVDFDPYIFDKDGKKQFYQRGLVWTLEQKKLLIDSIYNGIEIGKFIFRYRGWDYIVSEMKEKGHGFYFQMLDGKQRMNTLIDFVGNKFQDSHGNYFKELSTTAKRAFFSYNKLAIGQMDEETKDSEVIAAFLTLNFTGVPMSKEHLNFIKSINV